MLPQPMLCFFILLVTYKNVKVLLRTCLYNYLIRYVETVRLKFLNTINLFIRLVAVFFVSFDSGGLQLM